MKDKGIIGKFYGNNVRVEHVNWSSAMYMVEIKLEPLGGPS